MEKTHFKLASDSPYLGSWDLPEYKDIVLTIAKVEMKMTEGLKDNVFKNIVTFKEKGWKPMLLNSTNAKKIKILARTPYIEEWTGQRIQIYVQEGVKAFGELHDALRIRPTVPALKKPDLIPSSKSWEGAKKAVQEGTASFESLNKHYTITQENFNLLKE